jgi:hypothetical protein
MALVTARDARLLSAAQKTAYTTAITNITTATNSGLTNCDVAVALDIVTKNQLVEDGFTVKKLTDTSYNVDWSTPLVRKSL